METIEYTEVDSRTDWGVGPWDSEPIDKIQWRDPISGLPVMIRRGPLGAWCGYVGIEDPEHPWFEQDVWSLSDDDTSIHPEVQVHGGLTFASFCHEGDEPEGERICHVTEEGDPEKVWWLGFDTAHYMDLVPGMAPSSTYGKDMEKAGIPRPVLSEGSYKNQAYITTEVLGLARQIAEASP